MTADIRYRTLQRERFLQEQVYTLMRAQGFDMLQSLVIIGVSVFSLVLAIGGLAQVARVFEAIGRVNIAVPTPFGTQSIFNASSALPSPAFVGILQNVPLFGIKDAVSAALLVMFVILAIRVWQGYRLIKRMRTIRQMMREIDKDLTTIRRTTPPTH
jgi:hypothetical protein